MNLKDNSLDIPYLKTYPLSPIPKTTNIVVINVLDTETYDIKSLQHQDAYCKCIQNTLNMPSV